VPVVDDSVQVIKTPPNPSEDIDGVLF